MLVLFPKIQSSRSGSSKVISRNEFVKSHSYSRSRVDIKGIALLRSGERNEDVDTHESTHERVQEWLLAPLFLRLSLSFFFYLSHVATRAGYRGQLPRAHRPLPRPSCVIQGVSWTERRREDKKHWKKSYLSREPRRFPAGWFLFISDNRDRSVFCIS